MEVKQMNNRVHRILNGFIEQARVLLADNLKSIVLYGSVLSGGYSKRHSDLNILLVLEKADIQSLGQTAKIKRNPQFKDIAILVLTKQYLENSTDTFPMEFLDIQESYIILWGEDCIKGLHIDLKNLRHQCEWELKTKIIQMQRLYINSAGNATALRSFLTQSLPSFIVVFKNILRLKGKCENDKEKIVESIAAEFNVNKDILVTLWQSRSLGAKIADAQKAFDAFLQELESLSDSVDSLVE